MNDDINKRLDDINKNLDVIRSDNSLAHQGLKSMIQEVQKTQVERFDKIDEQLKRISQTFSGSTLEFLKDSKENIEHIGKHFSLKLPRDLGKSIEKIYASIRER